MFDKKMDGKNAIVVYYLDALFFVLKKYDINKDELLRCLVLNDNSISFNKEGLIKIWDHAVSLTKNESLGLEVGKQLQIGTYGIVGSIIMYSENIIVALNNTLRFHKLINEKDTIFLHDEVLCMALEYKLVKTQFQLPSYIIECLIVGFVNFLKRVLPFEFSPTQIEFKHPPPKDISMYEKFFNCPVIFNAKRCAISFGHEVLNYKIATANKELFNQHVNVAERMLLQLEHKVWKNRVEDKIHNDFCWGRLSSHSVADALGISHRKMQRNLNLENTNFRQIFDQIRKRKAKQLISQNQFSITEISKILGYNDNTSFHRSYQRWYGKTPKSK